jgi:alkylated DNA repair dioxygenase AlkB
MKRVFENIEKNVFLDKTIFPNLELLKKCISDIETQLEERPTIIVFDKICKQNRDVGFFSNDSKGYLYSQKLMESKPLSNAMIELLVSINTMLGAKYNGILVNKYNDGNDYIGAHSDSEVGLDPVGVACISYGSERNFRIRNKNDKKIVHEENTTHCSILHMGGKFQKYYTHEIPIQKKIKGVRFSFTFRKHTV